MTNKRNSNRNSAISDPPIIGTIRRNETRMGVYFEPRNKGVLLHDDPALAIDARTTQELADDIDRTISDMSRRIDVLAREFNLHNHFDTRAPSNGPRAA